MSFGCCSVSQSLKSFDDGFRDGNVWFHSRTHSLSLSGSLLIHTHIHYTRIHIGRTHTLTHSTRITTEVLQYTVQGSVTNYTHSGHS
jgi:hypothetical protein